LRYPESRMKRVVCPSCHKETTWEDNPSRPFCSERCRLIDLGRWATEEYRVALPEMLPDASVASVDLFDQTGPESAEEGERR
jgi:endogenous inhibitor of DNA gyrase (YacG/DUF329 family)